MKPEPKFPPGWDHKRVQDLIDHYESLSDEEQIAEDEAAFEEQEGRTAIVVPTDLLPEIQRLIASRKGA